MVKGGVREPNQTVEDDGLQPRLTSTLGSGDKGRHSRRVLGDVKPAQVVLGVVVRKRKFLT
jgi:hypothetical protein